MKLILLTALLLIGPGARAATFDLSVIGSGTHWYVNGVPGCDLANPVDGCNLGFATETWLGDLSVQTASATDGAYTDSSGLESITYTSNFDTFDYVVGDQQHLVYPTFGGFEPYLTGMAPGVSVTLFGGRVVDVTGSFLWGGSGSLDFSGLGLSNKHGGQLGQPDVDCWQLTGILSNAQSIPAASPAPEPATWLLFAIGLSALAVRKSPLCAERRWLHWRSR